MSVPFLPFYNKADQRAVPMLANFVKYTGPGKLNSYAAYAWAAGIALRDAVKRAVAAHGVNGVTRKTIFEQLDQIHKFSADGSACPSGTVMCGELCLPSCATGGATATSV